MSESKNDDLAALAGQAQGLEQAAAVQPGEGEPDGGAPRQGNAELLAGTFHMLREAGCVLGGVESPRRVLDDGTLTALGNAWGAVCDKRGWDLSRLMGDYGPELAAVMLSITVATRLNTAVRAELEAREPKKGEAKAGEVVEAAA